MLNPNPDIDIDSILNPNIESTSLVDVLVTTNDEIPPSSFKDRVKSLEDDFLEFKQTNLFAKAVSSIPGNVDKYLANQMNEAKIIKEQVSKILPRIEKLVNEQLEAEVLIRSSNKAKTSHAIAANLSEHELKKILIDKMENNKSIDISVQQKTLYKALVDAYEIDKDILETYGDTVTLKRQSTSAPKDKTSKSIGSSKEGSKSKTRSSGKSAQEEEQVHTVEDLEEPAHQEFNIGFTKDQPISTLARNKDPHESFNELMDTPLDFSAFVFNRLKVDTLTPELLVGPTFELMKGSCKSLVELEYFLEEVYKATTDQLGWKNPDGQQYPHDMRKPLPLIPNSRGRRVIPFNHFINNDLAYLSGGVSTRTYATSVTKTKAADYGHIKWIEDLVPNTIWINRESARDVYSKNRIIAIKKLVIVEWNNYKHLEWITVRRDDDKLYTFKEGDYNRLRLQDIEDMLLLLVQGKLTNLNIEERLALGFIYQNQDKKNRLMHIDELVKFSDGTLNDVRSALDDTLEN
ncbi:hypothetical protein Tco_0742793, partial [Tanacetum coccineum]